MLYVWNIDDQSGCALKHVCLLEGGWVGWGVRASSFVKTVCRTHLWQAGASHAANGGDVEMTGWSWRYRQGMC